MKIKTILSVSALLLVTACNGGDPISSSVVSSSSTTPTFDVEANLDKTNSVFDDFKDGISIDRWEIAQQQWGKNNNGVIHENVAYTADGYVILQANGDNYAGAKVGANGGSGKRTGAALISNDAYGPGRFEVRMKVLPRFGSTTAFWTYYFDDALSLNHEIDIELNVDNDFTSIWSTNWTTINDSDHHTTQTDIVNNDGEFHTYKFEWHTNPQRIDYYVDEILLHTSYTNIPTYAGRLWIGNWFPEGWAGTPDFETDYTLVDWIRYTPYLNNPYTPTSGRRSNFPSYYPTAPVELPVSNLISNPGFEGLKEAWRKDASSGVTIEANQGIDGSKAIFVPKDDITYQYITGLDESFEMVLKANVKIPANSTGGYLLIEYRPLETSLISFQKLEFLTSDAEYNVDGYYQKSLDLDIPTGTKRIELSLIGNSDGGFYLDNLFLNLMSKIPS